MKLNISQNIDKNDRFWIALAGPFVNFIICILCCALWWLVPETFTFSSTFFQTNLIIALFNILPIYPLDGGVMLNSLIKKANSKVADTISKTLNIIFIVGFLVFFFLSFDTTPNLMFLLYAVFFIVNTLNFKKKDDLDIYYKSLFKKQTNFSKVNMLKVDSNTTLFECFKNIKQDNYTVFYLQADKPLYITETELQMLLTKYDLNTKIKDVMK